MIPITRDEVDVKADTMETREIDEDIAMHVFYCYRITLRDGVCGGKTVNPSCFYCEAERVRIVVRGAIMVRAIVRRGRREIEVDVVERAEWARA